MNCSLSRLLGIFLHKPSGTQANIKFGIGIRLFPDKQYPGQNQGQISVQLYIRTIPSFNISGELKSCVLCSHEELLPERLMCSYCPKTYLTNKELSTHRIQVLYVFWEARRLLSENFGPVRALGRTRPLYWLEGFSMTKYPTNSGA